MEKIHWFPGKGGSWKGLLLPYFNIFKESLGKNKGKWILFIYDARPRFITLKSIQQGKIIAAKYLKEKFKKEEK